MSKSKRVRCPECGKLVGLQGMWRHLRAHAKKAGKLTAEQSKLRSERVFNEQRVEKEDMLANEIPFCERCQQKDLQIKELAKTVNEYYRTIRILQAVVGGVQ